MSRLSFYCFSLPLIVPNRSKHLHNAERRNTALLGRAQHLGSPNKVRNHQDPFDWIRRGILPGGNRDKILPRPSRISPLTFLGARYRRRAPAATRSRRWTRGGPTSATFATTAALPGRDSAASRALATTTCAPSAPPR